MQQHVLKCHACQVSKHENVISPGLLLSLPISQQAWIHITMDFIEQLPLSARKDTIWVIVDRFTTYGHFIGLAHPYSPSSLATLFLDVFYKLHGLPQSIVSDRDKVFTGHFWKQLL